MQPDGSVDEGVPMALSGKARPSEVLLPSHPSSHMWSLLLLCFHQEDDSRLQKLQ